MVDLALQQLLLQLKIHYFSGWIFGLGEEEAF